MRRALIAVLAVVLTAARAQEAFGQCTISSFEINGVVTLCADGGDAWQWSGPSGYTSANMCIEPPTAGTYELRIFDAASNTWSEPCSHMIGTPGTPPECSIAGPDSVCAGTTAQWCGPTGDFTYRWTGPYGFSSTERCATIPGPGLYTLWVSDAVFGTTGAPCTKTLFAKDCITPPPPPPVPPSTVLCPAPARWWHSSCDARTAPEMRSATFAQVAQKVDEHSAVWSFSGSPEGLCEVLTPVRHGRPFISARRQYAALHANVAAAELGMSDASGNALGLSSAMRVDHIRGVAPGTTLGQWVAAAEASLLAMNGGYSNDRKLRDECRRIRQQARELNQAARRNGCTGEIAILVDDDEDFDDLLAGGGTSIFTSGGTGSPFSGSGHMRWTLERAGQVRLDVVDLSGRRVRHLTDSQFAAGTHEFHWDGRDDSGRSLQPGAYFLSGTVSGQRVAQRLILLR
jgi:hypothetical protein